MIYRKKVPIEVEDHYDDYRIPADDYRIPAGAERSSETSSGKPSVEGGFVGTVEQKTVDQKTVEEHKAEEEKSRGTWGNQLQFVLTALGLAVGLGNIWRFPAMAYEHGGGAFIIPYMFCLFFFGLPMVYLEFYMGQYVRGAPAIVLRRYAPILQGVGWGAAISAAGLCAYYTIIIGWSSLYLISWSEIDQWKTCRNESKYCVSYELTEKNCNNITHTGNDTDSLYIFINGNCTNDAAVKKFAISAAEDYYQQRIMQMTDNLETLGDFNYRMAITHTILWLGIWLILVKGVTIMGYLSYVVVTLPYFIITVLFINGLTLEGAEIGLSFYWWNPNWEKVLEAETWIAALNQLCFSINIGYGGLMVLASYCKKDNNCFRNALILCIGDTVMSVVGGGAMFATLGYLAHQMGIPEKNFTNVVQTGTGLAFVAIPHAIAEMQWPALWSTLFFLMLISLGISTEIALVEVTCSCIYDLHPQTRRYKWVVSFIVCFVLFAAGMTMMFGNGVYIFNIFNTYIGTSGTVMVATLQAVAVVFFYGYKNANTDIKEIFGEPRNVITKYIGPTSLYWQFNWMFISPVLAMIILVLILIAPNPTYGKDEKPYPTYMLIFGWFLGLSPLAMIIPDAVTNIIKARNEGKPLMDVFRVQPDHPSYNRIHGILPIGPTVDDTKQTKVTKDGTQEDSKISVESASRVEEKKTVDASHTKKTNEE